MKPIKLLALGLAATLSIPTSIAQACVGTSVEVSLEGDASGNDPLKLTTPATDGEPARTWVDDDGLPTLMTALQSMEKMKDVSAYGDLFKKSLERLSKQSEAYAKQSNVDDETKVHFKAVADGSKNFLASMKDKPFDKKMVAAFYEKMGETIKGAIQEGVYAYKVLNPKTGKPEDKDEPFSMVGEFGPAVKFWDKVEGNVPRGGGCDGYTLKIKAAKAKGESGAGTYMVNPGE